MMFYDITYGAADADYPRLAGVGERRDQGRAGAKTTWLQGLSERLAAIGVKESERNLSNKIGRGTFSAVFLFQCMIRNRAIHFDSR